MKKLTLLSFLLLTVFLGCRKESSGPSNPAVQNQQSGSSLYRLGTDKDGKLGISKAALPKLMSENKFSRASNPNAAGVVTCNFSAILGATYPYANTAVVVSNNDGVNGKIQVQGFVSLKLDAYCLQVQGNEAIYSGIITSVQDAGDYGAYLVPGNYCIFRVKDNGTGNKAPLSQTPEFFYIWETAVDGAMPCSYDWFGEDWGDLINISQGRIDVK